MRSRDDFDWHDDVERTARAALPELVRIFSGSGTLPERMAAAKRAYIEAKKRECPGYPAAFYQGLERAIDDNCARVLRGESIDRVAHLTTNTGDLAWFSMDRTAPENASLFADVPGIEDQVKDGSILRLDQIDPALRIALHRWSRGHWSLDILAVEGVVRRRFPGIRLDVPLQGSPLVARWTSLGLFPVPVVANTLWLGSQAGWESVWREHFVPTIQGLREMGLAQADIPMPPAPALVTTIHPTPVSLAVDPTNLAQAERLVSVVLAERTST